MRIRLLAAVTASRLTAFICRMVRHGGTSLPGRIALKLHPGLIQEESARYRAIIVTGTNGKTTTTKMIGRILSENGVQFITNKSGANLKSGIAAAFSENAFRRRHSPSAIRPLSGSDAEHTGGMPVMFALLETDEAAFGVVSRLINPEFIVVTNFFRDQLDRYGELYTTLGNVRAGIAGSPAAVLILNADDSLCASLGRDVPNKVLYFGLSREAAGSGSAHGGAAAAANYDALYCLYCKSAYEYTFTAYGHLGGFRCPSCGYARHVPDVLCTYAGILPDGGMQASFVVSDSLREKFPPPPAAPGESDGAPRCMTLPLTGLYNVYNALASLTCTLAIPLPPDKAVSALASFESGFGRMETINAGSATIKLILVKNPTGFNQALSLLMSETRTYSAAFIINDRIADGTDISWLWDVDFESYAGHAGKPDSFFVSGLRAEDMAVRLKYAGFNTYGISIIGSYEALIDKGLAEAGAGGTFYILPTYTAMLDLRKKLKAKYKLKNFWE